MSHPGVDAAARAREQRHERGAHRVAVDDGGVAVEQVADQNQANQGDTDDREAHNRAATDGDTERPLDAFLARGFGRAAVGARRDRHADEARQTGGEGADDEGDGGAPTHAGLGRELGPDGAGDRQKDADHDDERRDVAVFAAQERLGPRLHGVGNLNHGRVAAALLHEVSRQPQDDEHRHDTADQRQPEQSHMELHSLDPRFCQWIPDVWQSREKALKCRPTGLFVGPSGGRRQVCRNAGRGYPCPHLHRPLSTRQGTKPNSLPSDT